MTEMVIPRFDNIANQLPIRYLYICLTAVIVIHDSRAVAVFRENFLSYFPIRHQRKIFNFV